MISFRYHLVSIVAVFLALALGIVVGTTALNGPITTDLRKQVNTLKGDRNSLAQQVKTLHGQVGDANAFAEEFGTEIVTNTLSKKTALIIALPGAARSTVDGVESQIAAAGGTTSRLELTSSYVDQRRGGDITTLVTSIHPSGLTLPEVNDPGQLGGAELAYVLLGRGQATDLDQVLGAFSELHMISVSGGRLTPSTTIVVVGTGAMRVGDYSASMELSLVRALSQAGGHLVVAGNGASAAQAGIVAAVRSSGSDRSAVSTVDNADTAIGQVSTVLALAAAANDQSAGHYGTAKGAEALFPSAPK
ncbi:MAG TPA: copper transporter [Jatrophihabitantaceae bacterium]|nr:copper transporter [Jatrophihabitantaceae bacterium]